MDKEYFSTFVEYNPEDGKFRWKWRDPEQHHRPSRVKAWNSRYSGKVAGSVHTSRGYYKRVYVTIEAKKYLAHHLVLLFEGVVNCLYDIKGFEIDHRNGDPTDNHIDNLRVVSASRNRRNSKRNSKNTSGYNGVRKRKDTGKWVAQVGGLDAKNLGSFDTIEEAIEARRTYDEENGFTDLHGVR